MGKQASQGSTSERSQRGPHGQQKGLFSLANRALLGQLAKPPETAISVPLQQAISNQQAGLPAMRAQFGLGGGLVNQLTGQGVGGGTMTPGPNQTGLQSRAQLGLPDRRDYMTFIPTADELAALGAVPPVGQTPFNKKLDKLEGRIERRQAKGKDTTKAEARRDRMQARTGGI